MDWLPVFAFMDKGVRHEADTILCTSKTKGHVVSLDGYGFLPSCHNYRACAGCRRIKIDHLVEQIRHEQQNARKHWQSVFGYAMVRDGDWDAWRKRENRAAKSDPMRRRRLRIPQPGDRSLVIARHPDPAPHELPPRLEPWLWTLLERVPKGARICGQPTGRAKVVKTNRQEKWGGDHAGAWRKKKNNRRWVWCEGSQQDLHDVLVAWCEANDIPCAVTLNNGLLDFSGMPPDQREAALLIYAPEVILDLERE